MAICISGEKLYLLQEATGIRRGRLYPVANNYKTDLTAKHWRRCVGYIDSCGDLQSNQSGHRLQ